MQPRKALNLSTKHVSTTEVSGGKCFNQTADNIRTEMDLSRGDGLTLCRYRHYFLTTTAIVIITKVLNGGSWTPFKQLGIDPDRMLWGKV